MGGVELDIDAVFQLEDASLKQHLEERSLPTDGDRSDLQERLLHHITMNTSVLDSQDDDTFKHSTVDSILGDQSAMLEESIDVGASVEPEKDATEESSQRDSKVEESIDFLLEKDSPLTTPGGTSPQSADDCTSEEKTEPKVDSSKKKDSVTERIKNVTAAAKIGKKTPAVNGKTDSNPDRVIKTRPLPNSRKMNIIRVVPPSTKVEKLEQRSKRFGGATNDEEKKKLRLGRFSATPDPASAKSPVESAPERVTVTTQPLRGSPADRLKERQARFADANLKKRQERFGTVTSRSLNVNVDMKTRKLMRAQKFGTVS